MKQPSGQSSRKMKGNTSQIAAGANCPTHSALKNYRKRFSSANPTPTPFLQPGLNHTSCFVTSPEMGGVVAPTWWTSSSSIPWGKTFPLGWEWKTRSSGGGERDSVKFLLNWRFRRPPIRPQTTLRFVRKLSFAFIKNQLSCTYFTFTFTLDHSFINLGC